MPIKKQPRRRVRKARPQKGEGFLGDLAKGLGRVLLPIVSDVAKKGVDALAVKAKRKLGGGLKLAGQGRGAGLKLAGQGKKKGPVQRQKAKFILM